MKTKIEIKSWMGSLLFEHEEEDNSLKKTLETAAKSRANLYGANLYGADLSRANLSRANLYGAKNIPEKYYTICRDDLWSVLSAAPLEVKGLRKAIVEGKIDGSAYEGACACLVGTIANVKGCKFDSMENLKPDSSRPIEAFFTQIKPGDVPDKSDSAKRAVEWIDQWLQNVAMLKSNETNPQKD